MSLQPNWSTTEPTPIQPRNGVQVLPARVPPLQVAVKSTSRPPPPRRIVYQSTGHTNTNTTGPPLRRPLPFPLVDSPRSPDNNILEDNDDDVSISDSGTEGSEDSDASSSSIESESESGPEDIDNAAEAIPAVLLNGLNLTRRVIRRYAVKSTSLPPPPLRRNGNRSNNEAIDPELINRRGYAVQNSTSLPLGRIVNDSSNVVAAEVRRLRLTRQPSIPVTVKEKSSPRTLHSNVRTFLSGLPGYVEGISMLTGNEHGKRKSSSDFGKSDAENDCTIKQVKLGDESKDEKEQGQ